MKTFDERLNDYVLSHPGFNAEIVYDYILQQHKKAIWKLQHRVERRLENMLTSNASVLFLTLTFDDEHLPTKENEKLTQTLVFDYLSRQKGVISFVANTDYGKENGRFHWHAVVLSDLDLTHETWIYGSVDFLRIRKTSVPLQLTRYLIKLKRHSTKILDPFIIYFPIHFRANGGD